MMEPEPQRGRPKAVALLGVKLLVAVGLIGFLIGCAWLGSVVWGPNFSFWDTTLTW